METNKLIAEFMVRDNRADKTHTTEEMKNNFLEEVMFYALGGVWEREDELRYHASWDWLKPVVDEIEMRCQGVPQELLHLSLFSTRQEVYQAVVEFIKNQNK